MNNSINSLQKRIAAILISLLFVFTALLFRLLYIQVFKNKWLNEKVANQWLRELPLNAKRGNIYDRNGAILAESVSCYDVYVRGSRIKEPNKVSRVLSEILNIDYSTVFNKVTNTKISESLIKKQVEENVANKIIKMNLSGVMFSENNKRYYPYNDMLTQVLGFTSIDNFGQAGMEAYYDSYLKGTKGFATEFSDVHGVKMDNTLSNYVPSVPGNNITLTIDSNIQKFAENALNKLMEEQKPKSASAIVMNPNNGEILAMATKPSFNLNNPPRNNIVELMKTVKNLNIVDVYEPGSTFKVLTTATALEEKRTTPEERFFDPGYRIIDGEKIKCWKLKGHGSQSMTEGLCNSCNSVFVDLALRLGKDKMYEYFNKYGLGKKLDLDFMGESSGILMNKEKVKRVDLARMGFGQAVAVTPIQQINAICSVLNGGELLKPYFVKSIKDVYGKEILTNNKKVINKTISLKTSEKIREMLEAVILKSNAIEAFIPGFRVSGKTGTTQKYENGRINGKYIASFVGAFPANKPEYVTLIIADEPGGDSYYGSIVATPYAKLIFKDIIKYKKYKPENLESDLKILERNIEMPNVLGLDVLEALTKLENMGLQVEIQGEGNIIKKQIPQEKTMLYKNGVVIIETD